jgi:phosphatidylserine decarboxylase
MRFIMSHNGFIAGEGLPFIIPMLGLTILAFAAGFKGISWVFLAMTLFVIWFFRNPERCAPEKESLVISPADGKVIRIEDATSDERPGKTFKKISIFMNIFNVHVNRMPYSGKIQFIHYRKGRFLSADLDKASALNERNTVLLQTVDGREIITVQIAGLIARRIVCWLKEGMQVSKGERFGLIRFGSRVEVLLPLGTTLLVSVGEKVRAGETPIGELI